MVKAVKGVLLECDSTVKQIVLNLNKRGNFVIEDLGETHLFIEASWVDQLKYELDKILDENSYTISVEEKESKKNDSLISLFMLYTVIRRKKDVEFFQSKVLLLNYLLIFPRASGDILYKRYSFQR